MHQYLITDQHLIITFQIICSICICIYIIPIHILLCLYIPRSLRRLLILIISSYLVSLVRLHAIAFGDILCSEVVEVLLDGLSDQ